MNIWAHRGASFAFPENTISAFREALRYDIAGIELDIQLTKDGRLAVIHDETVDRTTDGSGPVKEYTLAGLQALRVPAGEDRSERIPSIEEVFGLLREPCLSRDLRINIELKNSKERYDGMEERILGTVREFGLEDQVVYSSFLPESVGLIKKLDPSAQTAILAPLFSEGLALAEKYHADGVHAHIQKIDTVPARAFTCRPVRAWTAGMEPFFGETGRRETLDLKKAREQGVTDVFTNFPEIYAGRLVPEGASREPEMTSGLCVREQDGRLKGCSAGILTNGEPLRVKSGSRLYQMGPALPARLWFYDMKRPEQWIRTYSYSPESCWMTFDPEHSLQEWNGEPKVMEKDGFIRLEAHLPGPESSAGLVCRESAENGPEAAGNSSTLPSEKQAVLSAPDNNEKPVPDTAPRVHGNIGRTSFVLEYPRGTGEKEAGIRPCFREEILRMSKRIGRDRTPEEALLFLLADTHYTVNGIWEETGKNVRALAGRCTPDAVIHLGDLTDGMLPWPATLDFSRRVLWDLKKTGAPVYLCIGNHDTNYFRGNPDPIRASEAAKLLMGRKKPYYYEDLPAAKLRMIFLASFNPQFEEREKRYGFAPEVIRWLSRTLKRTPEEYRVLVFSHVPLLPRMHVWSQGIRGSEKTVRILETFQQKRGTLLAFIHGHNHADQTDRSLSFPVVSVGCGKLESFPEKKPAGSVCFEREEGERTQDLWDVLRVRKDGGLEFLRFGAGEDRILEPERIV